MVRRLARRNRNATPEGLQEQGQSRRIPAANAADDGPNKKSTHPATAASLASSWAEATTRGSAIHTVARQLAAELQNVRGPIPPTLIAGIIARWRDELAYNTVSGRLSALKRIIPAIDRELHTNLALLLPRPGAPHPRNRIATPEELARLLAKAKPHMRLLILLGTQMGLRFAEMLRAHPTGYDKTNATLSIVTKGGKQRIIRVTAAIADLFAIAPDIEGGYIERLRGGRCTRFPIYQDWRRLCKQAAIEKTLIPHDLRRTAAVAIYRHTKDVFAAKALLGHEQLSTTAYYLKAHEDSLSPIDLAFWTPKGERPQ